MTNEVLTEALAKEISQKSVLSIVISAKCQLDYVPVPRGKIIMFNTEDPKHSRNALRTKLSIERTHLDQKRYDESMSFDEFKELDLKHYDFLLRTLFDAKEDYHVAIGD